METKQTVNSTTFTFVKLLGCIIFLNTCSSSSSPTSGNGDNLFGSNIDWLINPSEIVDGGPGIDGIPSLENPRFTIASEVEFLQDGRRVTAIRIDDDIRAYPHQIMDHHEIVNDSFDDIDVAVTFCPLTGTSIGIERNLGGNSVEYGVSGLLFRNNLIMYDRFSTSFWSQMQLRSVGGDFGGIDVNVVQVIETDWATWKQMYPNSRVLNTNTGSERNYSGFLYGSEYTTNDQQIIFPINNNDDRLNRKDRVHAILPSGANQNVEVKAYTLKDFSDGTVIVNDSFMGNDYLIIGNLEHDFINAFRLSNAFEQSLEFTVLDDPSGNVIMTDQAGNEWDIFGYAVSGPNEGEQLTPARSYTGYWFALADFFPEIELYND